MQEAEDQLLSGIGFPADGYRLFEIACLAGSCKRGWLQSPGESNCVFLRQGDMQALGGLDEGFASPGGGLVNADFFRRAAALSGVVPICLAGEGSFHQLHGGVTTNVSEAEYARRYAECLEEYRRLRGYEFERPVFTPMLLGELPPVTHRFLTPLPPPPDASAEPAGAQLPEPSLLSRLFRQAR
jgi:hypothetical protein